MRSHQHLFFKYILKMPWSRRYQHSLDVLGVTGMDRLLGVGYRGMNYGIIAIPSVN